MATNPSQPGQHDEHAVSHDEELLNGCNYSSDEESTDSVWSHNDESAESVTTDNDSDNDADHEPGWDELFAVFQPGINEAHHGGGHMDVDNDFAPSWAFAEFLHQGPLDVDWDSDDTVSRHSGDISIWGVEETDQADLNSVVNGEVENNVNDVLGGAPTAQNLSENRLANWADEGFWSWNAYNPRSDDPLD